MTDNKGKLENLCREKEVASNAANQAQYEAEKAAAKVKSSK